MVQDLDLLHKELSYKQLSDDSKLDIMNQAVAPCPVIIMSLKGKSVKSLLASMVTLINESYFKEHLKHLLLPSSDAHNNTHNLFNLRGVEESNVPLSKHFECDVEVSYISGSFSVESQISENHGKN